MDSLQRTVLFDAHVAAGGRMVPFAGWEMPVQYSGVIPEVKAVREGCGVFDVSHMARFAARGADVAGALNAIVCSDWSLAPNSSATYSLLLNQNGGVIDDIMGYHVDAQQWDIVSNASRVVEVEAHLRAHLPSHIELENRTDKTAMLAIQGPRAFEILSAHGNLPHPMVWRNYLPAELFGIGGSLARGGYTGSDGFEFIFPAEKAALVWDNLLKAGVTPCGLGARDVLRLEAGLPLYGHELREEWTPAESGAGWAFKPDKGEFIGREAASREPQQRIVALQMEGKAIPREGYKIARDGEIIGEITSGTMSPIVGAGIALAASKVKLAVGDSVDVVVRDKPQAARVVKKTVCAACARLIPRNQKRKSANEVKRRCVSLRHFTGTLHANIELFKLGALHPTKSRLESRVKGSTRVSRRDSGGHQEI